jgi:hypothetical protein
MINLVEQRLVVEGKIWGDRSAEMESATATSRGTNRKDTIGQKDKKKISAPLYRDPLFWAIVFFLYLYITA